MIYQHISNGERGPGGCEDGIVVPQATGFKMLRHVQDAVPLKLILPVIPIVHCCALSWIPAGLSQLTGPRHQELSIAAKPQNPVFISEDLENRIDSVIDDWGHYVASVFFALCFSGAARSCKFANRSLKI